MFCESPPKSALYSLYLSLRFLHRLCKQRVNYSIAQVSLVYSSPWRRVWKKSTHMHTISLSFDIILAIMRIEWLKRLNAFPNIPSFICSYFLMDLVKLVLSSTLINFGHFKWLLIVIFDLKKPKILYQRFISLKWTTSWRINC